MPLINGDKLLDLLALIKLELRLLIRLEPSLELITLKMQSMVAILLDQWKEKLNSGLVVILKHAQWKPHIVMNGLAGQIIDIILSEGFEISAMEMFYLDRPTIEEFYDVYKGVLPEYVPLIEHITTGPSIVLEVR
jgi:hypothetical protein